MLTSKFLQGLGCKTNTAVDGLDALKKIDLERYDLVLMVRSSLDADLKDSSTDNQNLLLLGYCHAHARRCIGYLNHS